MIKSTYRRAPDRIAARAGRQSHTYSRGAVCWRKSMVLSAVMVWWSSIAVLAQDERPLLADVELQKVFIDANREKMLERYQDAAYLFKEVLKKDPDNHSAAYELARMYDVLEKDGLALQAIKKAVKYAPDNVWYMDFYAQVLDRNNKPAEAAKAYAQLSAAHPDNEYFMFQQALFHIKANEPEKAVVIYNRLEKKMGVNEELAKKKYTLYYGMGDGKAAVAEMENLIKAFPEEVRYLQILADFHTKENNEKAARRTYKRILELDPGNAEAKMALADEKKQGGDHIGYFGEIRGIIGKKDVNIDVKVKELLPYITMIGENGDAQFVEEALSLGGLLTQTHPEEAKAHSLYADMLYQAGRLREALAEYDKTLELDKSVFAVWEQTMYLHLELRDMDALIRTSEQAMDYFPNQARVYYLNGIAQSNGRHFGDAVDMFRQALMMSGKNKALQYDIYNRLGAAYAEEGRYGESDKAFEKALAMMPDGHLTLHNYSYYLARRNENLQKAREMAFKANQIKPDQPILLANLGRIHFLLKNYKESLKWLEKSIANGGGDNAEVLEVYGDTLYKLNEKDKALEKWRKAKELGGDGKVLDGKIGGGL